MRPLLVTILITLSPCVVAGGAGTPDLCSSPKFQTAFLEGWLNAEDFPALSGNLLAYGDVAVPCLDEIARRGGEPLGFTQCKGRDESCRGWALRALSEIQTPKAKQSLLRMLDLGWTGQPLYGLLGAITTIRPPESRPVLLKVLESADPHARSWAMLAVGALGNKDDFDAMVRCARRLPVAELNRAARAFEFLADPRAVPVLRELAAPLPERSRGEIDDAIQRLERGEPIRPDWGQRPKR